MSDDIAWAAGLFEGEGHFSIARRHDSEIVYLVVGLTTTDKDVIDHFAAITGMGVRAKARWRKGKAHWKPTWTCSATGIRALEIAAILEPYLGSRRLARLHEIRQLVNDSAPEPRPCVCCGKPFVPSHFHTLQRACSERCRDRSKYLRRKYGIESEAEAYERGLLRADRPETRDSCPQGHPYAGDNLFIYRRRDDRYERRCRECARRQMRESYAKRKANPLAALLRAER